jgi:hypothetical protein
VGLGVGIELGLGEGVEPESLLMAVTCCDIWERSAALTAAFPATIVKPRAPMISAYSDAELPSSLRMRHRIK